MPDLPPDYSDYAYEHRPPAGSFRDWLQKHSVQRIGLWLFFLGFIPIGVYSVIAASPAPEEEIGLFVYLLCFWWFACWASSLTLYALKGQAPGIVTIYGPVGAFISGFWAIIGWSLTLLILYFGLCKLLGCGG